LCYYEIKQPASPASSGWTPILLSKEFLSISQLGFRPLEPFQISMPNKAPLLSMV
jgi:hypothetical protein